MNKVTFYYTCPECGLEVSSEGPLVGPLYCGTKGHMRTELELTHFIREPAMTGEF